MNIVALLVLAVLPLYSFAGGEEGWEEDTLDVNGGMLGKKMSISVPTLSEEEAESVQIPGNLKCCGCIAVAYNIQKQIEAAEANLPKSKKDMPISEVAIIETFEKACSRATYDDYGVSEVEGKKFLKGDGLPYMTERAGASIGGSLWPSRLSRTCSLFTGDETWEDGEEEFYLTFWRKSKKNFTHELCVNKMKYCTNEQLKLRMTPYANNDIKKSNKSKKTKKRKRKRKSGRKKKVHQGLNKTEL